MGEPVFSGFDWDHGNCQKCLQHGVSQAEIESLFSGKVALFPDPKHSAQEERFLAIGTTDTGRHVLLAFTFRKRAGRTLIRPISARFMHKKEIEHYEKVEKEAAKQETAKAAK